MDDNSLSNTPSHKEAPRRFPPREGLGKPFGCVSVGKSVARNIIVETCFVGIPLTST